MVVPWYLERESRLSIWGATRHVIEQLDSFTKSVLLFADIVSLVLYFAGGSVWCPTKLCVIVFHVEREGGNNKLP